MSGLSAEELAEAMDYLDGMLPHDETSGPCPACDVRDAITARDQEIERLRDELRAALRYQRVQDKMGTGNAAHGDNP